MRLATGAPRNSRAVDSVQLPIMPGSRWLCQDNLTQHDSPSASAISISQASLDPIELVRAALSKEAAPLIAIESISQPVRPR